MNSFVTTFGLMIGLATLLGCTPLTSMMPDIPHVLPEFNTGNVPKPSTRNQSKTIKETPIHCSGNLSTESPLSVEAGYTWSMHVSRFIVRDTMLELRAEGGDNSGGTYRISATAYPKDGTYHTPEVTFFYTDKDKSTFPWNAVLSMTIQVTDQTCTISGDWKDIDPTTRETTMYRFHGKLNRIR